MNISVSRNLYFLNNSNSEKISDKAVYLNIVETLK